MNKLQRLLGLKIPRRWQAAVRSMVAERDRPVIFVTHMEHHSNHISWAETIGEVVCISPGADGRVNPEHLERMGSERMLRRERELDLSEISAVATVRILVWLENVSCQI